MRAHSLTEMGRTNSGRGFPSEGDAASPGSRWSPMRRSAATEATATSGAENAIFIGANPPLTCCNRATRRETPRTNSKAARAPRLTEACPPTRFRARRQVHENPKRRCRSRDPEPGQHARDRVLEHVAVKAVSYTHLTLPTKRIV